MLTSVRSKLNGGWRFGVTLLSYSWSQWIPSIYIYVCVCVCVCMYGIFLHFDENENVDFHEK